MNSFFSNKPQLFCFSNVQMIAMCLYHFQKNPLSFNFYVFFENEGLLSTWGERVPLLGIKGGLLVFVPLVCSTVYEGGGRGA